MRLLLVEDDKMLGESVQIGLQEEGYAVDWVRDGQSAQMALQSHSYAAVLLDLGLPDRNGLQILRWMRTKGSAVAVLIVTARDEIRERVEGLNAGADDYILKPFDLDELSARVRAVVRRLNGRAEDAVVVGQVQLDVAAKRVTQAGELIELTAREYAIIAYLMQRRGRIVTRNQLEEALFEWSHEVESNVVEVYISQIRRKLGKDFIRTRRGLGYSVE